MTRPGAVWNLSEEITQLGYEPSHQKLSLVALVPCRRFIGSGLRKPLSDEAIQQVRKMRRVQKIAKIKRLHLKALMIFGIRVGWWGNFRHEIEQFRENSALLSQGVD